MSKSFLVSRLGNEGEKLYGMIRGITGYTQKKQNPLQQVSSEIEFTRNTNNLPTLHAAIQYLADQLCFKLRQDKAKTKKIIEIITFSDGKYSQQTHTFHTSTWKYDDVFYAATNLFSALFTRRISIRKITLKSGPLFTDDGQLELFESQKEKKYNKVAEALDHIRNTFGFDAVKNAETMSLSKPG